MSNPPQDNSRIPLIRQVPPISVASPSELRPRTPGDVRWYRPSLGETMQLMGWRWIYFIPAALMLVSLFLLPWQMWLLQFFVLWWKLAVIAVVLPTGYALNVAKHILRSRKEPFCIHCGYELTGLVDDHICPECGERYTFRLIEEYKRDPQWFIKRYHMHQDIPIRDVPFEAGKSAKRKSRDGT
jgi:hypothetical protein